MRRCSEKTPSSDKQEQSMQFVVPDLISPDNKFELLF